MTAHSLNYWAQLESLMLRFGLLSAAIPAVIISNHIRYLQISASFVCVRAANTHCSFM